MADTSGIPGTEEGARWFESDLLVCPRCGQHTVLSGAPDVGATGRVCMTCGPLDEALEPEP